jgi:hypothetical protein
MSCWLTRRLGLGMTFLFVGSRFCTPASFRRSVALPPLPSASGLIMVFHNGSPTGDFHPISYSAPMSGVHQPMHLTEIPLRFISASDRIVRQQKRQRRNLQTEPTAE